MISPCSGFFSPIFFFIVLDDKPPCFRNESPACGRRYLILLAGGDNGVSLAAAMGTRFARSCLRSGSVMKAAPDAWRRLCTRQVTPTITGGRILSEDIVLKAAIDNEGTQLPASAAAPAPLE